MYFVTHSYCAAHTSSSCHRAYYREGAISVEHVCAMKLLMLGLDWPLVLVIGLKNGSVKVLPLF